MQLTNQFNLSDVHVTAVLCISVSSQILKPLTLKFTDFSITFQDWGYLQAFSRFLKNSTVEYLNSRITLYERLSMRMGEMLISEI